MPFYQLRGGEVLANSYAAGHQDAASVTYLANGNIVIVWRNAGLSGGDPTGTLVRARIFSPTGAPLGDDFLVNATTAGDQNEPCVISLSTGGFVVAWTDADPSGINTPSWIRAQIYDAAGAKIGTEFIVSSATSANQFNPNLTALPGGKFLAVWSDASASPADIKGQVFDGQGQRIGTEFQINSAVQNVFGDDEPAVTVLAGGRFMVTWSTLEIEAQLFEADGTRVGGQFRVNTATSQDQYRSDVAALAGGGFVVTWSDYSSSGATGGPEVRARMFDQNGIAVGAETQVNVAMYGSQYGAFVAGLASGGFVVAWTDTSSGDGTQNNVKARVFTATGAADGGEFIVSTTLTGLQYATGVSASGNTFTVAWADLSGSGGDSSGSSIKFSRFELSSTAANTPPLLTLPNTSLTMPEDHVNAFGWRFAQSALFFDAEGNLPGGRLTVTGLLAEDRVTITPGTHTGNAAGWVDITVNGNYVLANGVVIGVMTGGGGSDFTLTFNAAATVLYVEAAIGLLQYRNASDAPTANRTLYVNVTDGAGASVASPGIAVHMTVTPQNDAPVVDMNGFTEGPAQVTFTEGAPNVLLGQFATVIDPDSANFDGGSLAVGIADGQSAGDRILLLSQGSGPGQISVSGNALLYQGVIIGTVTFEATHFNAFLNANATPAAIQAVLRRVAFANGSADIDSRSRYVQVQLRDGDGGDSYGGTSVAIVPVNSPPALSLTGHAASFVEGDNAPSAPVWFLPDIVVTDPDSVGLSRATVRITDYRPGEDQLIFRTDIAFGDITAVFNAATGTLTLTSATGASISDWRSALTSVQYLNLSENPGGTSRTVQISVVDSGGLSSNAVSRVISVTAVNDRTLVDIDGANPNNTANTVYTEQAAPVALVPDAVLTDPDGNNFAGGQLIVRYPPSISGPFPGQEYDQLGIITRGGVTVSGYFVLYNGGVVGSFVPGGSGTTPLVVTFNSAASIQSVQAVMRAVSYYNGSDAPPSFTRGFEIVLIDGAGTSTATAYAYANVAQVNDPIVVDLNGSRAGVAGQAYYSAGDPAQLVAPHARVTDPDGGNFAGGTLRFQINNPSAGDNLTLKVTDPTTGEGGVFIDINGMIAWNGMTVGQLTITSPTSATILFSVQFVGLDAVEGIIRAVGYVNSGAQPATGNRTISFSVTEPGSSVPVTQNVTLTYGAEPSPPPAQTLTGDAFVNHLAGGEGDDTITGGWGGDRLTGGLGSDRFVYNSVEDSRPYLMRSDGKKDLPDLIRDFATGEDVIDLSGIDANSTTASNDAFIWIGGGVFGNRAGELRVVRENGAWNLYGDVNGDGIADLHIAIQGDMPLLADLVL